MGILGYNRITKSYLWQMGFDVGEARARSGQASPSRQSCDRPVALPRKGVSDVDTDRPIKLLFERQAQTLLPFIGETNARVTAAGPLTFERPSREVDCVLRLEHDGALWYRHLEFLSGPDPDAARRCFELNTRLYLLYHAPVLTTIVYLCPTAALWSKDAFHVRIRDRLAYDWRFDVVRLWEISVESALESGQAGPLALVPLLRGGASPEKVQEAVRKLDALPSPQSAEAMSALVHFASEYLDEFTLMRVLGKDRIMHSYLWQMGRDTGEIEGRTEGLAEGEAKAAREICVDLAQSLHPCVATRVLPVIEACEEPETLRAWILECPKLSDAAFAALVHEQAHVAQARGDHKPPLARVPPPRVRPQRAVGRDTTSCRASSLATRGRRLDPFAHRGQSWRRSSCRSPLYSRPIWTAQTRFRTSSGTSQ